MWGDVVLERIVRIFELYDGERPVDNFVLNNIRWYAFKWMNKRRDHQVIEEESQVAYDKHSFLDALDHLNEVERYLIDAKVFYDMSYKQIAEELGWSPQQVTKSFKYVCDKLRLIYEV